MKKLSSDQIITLQKMLIKLTGGAAGIRDFNLLESAVNAPYH